MRVRIILILFFLFYGKVWAAELLQAPALIHISSTISEGKYAVDEIAQIAQKSGIKVVIITDYYLSAFSYGIWPLENVIKKTVEFNSVSRHGINNYLKEISKVGKKNPDMVFIPAVEVAPFYYWEGSVLGNNLKVKDWHKHLLAIGLEKPGDYENLPILGNKNGLFLPFCFKDMLLFWPLVMILLGLLYCRKNKFCPGILILLTGLVFLFNNFPFRCSKFTQYEGSLGIKPYQHFIDYVKDHGGLTFWAHPEAENVQREGKIKIETRDYTSDLVAADHYTGFAVFYEGYKEIGCLGCLWDEILIQYCRGIRKSPVWAIGGLSFDDRGKLEEALKDLRTVLLLASLNKQDALGALRQGSMYVARGSNSSKFILDEFSIKDSSRDASKTMGQTLKLAAEPKIKIKGHFLSNEEFNVKIKLIREGKIIKTFETAAPFDISYKDAGRPPVSKTYYRLELESKGLLLVTNPIFVEAGDLK